MTNTLENKAKFFAQYWGQEVFGSPYLKGSWCYTGENFDEIDESVWMNLKPLSSITDEDAKEICKIVRPDVKWKNYSKDSIYRFANTFSEHNVLGCDYFRSKGYALPYMGLSVETLIEYGWIKLI